MARSGAIPPQTQSCVAIGDSAGHWYLVNASPDISHQLLGFPELHPRRDSVRSSPIGAVFLTNADLDHVLGLFSLREGTGFEIYATASVRAAAEEALGLETVLKCFCGPRWKEPALEDFTPILQDAGSGCELCYRAIALPGQPPPFARGVRHEIGNSVAYQFLDMRTEKKVMVAPDVGAVNPAFQDALESSDAVLFDGTFWSADELAAVRPGAKPAGEMGHLPIRDNSLALLSGLRAPKKFYIHINNTNPILVPGSAERVAVERAGIVVGADGMEFEI